MSSGRLIPICAGNWCGHHHRPRLPRAGCMRVLSLTASRCSCRVDLAVTAGLCLICGACVSRTGHVSQCRHPRSSMQRSALSGCVRTCKSSTMPRPSADSAIRWCTSREARPPQCSSLVASLQGTDVTTCSAHWTGTSVAMPAAWAARLLLSMTCCNCDSLAAPGVWTSSALPLRSTARVRYSAVCLAAVSCILRTGSEASLAADQRAVTPVACSSLADARRRAPPSATYGRGTRRLATRMMDGSSCTRLAELPLQNDQRILPLWSPMPFTCSAAPTELVLSR
mmetsp:Transcript_18706/g.40329  ORF Transcript_18706/g.40329 Transcript_18706/m.40329 type:complete len:283 (-) Transcript_18706:778-1626(-)